MMRFRRCYLGVVEALPEDVPGAALPVPVIGEEPPGVAVPIPPDDPLAALVPVL